MTYEDATNGDGEVDAPINTTTAVVSNEFGLPTFDELSNAPAIENRAVYITGNGSDIKGVHVYDGAEYRHIGALEIVHEDTITLSGTVGQDDTGVAVDTSAYYMALPSPQSQGNIALSLEHNGSTYVVHAEENGTSDNPDVGYILVRGPASLTDSSGGSGGVDLENTDGTALVADAEAIQAGNGLEFGDDNDNTGTLNYVGDSSVDGTDISPQRIIPDLITTQQQAVNDRPLYTVQEKTGSDALWVDPGNGDDGLATPNVSETNPLNTLNEAMTRIPFIIQHDWHIRLEDGIYDAESALSGPVFSVSGWNSQGVVPQFKIQGNSTSPGNVVVDANYWNLAHRNPEWDDTGSDAVINSLHFTGTLNNKGGLFSVANVTFTGASAPAAILGKGGGKTVFHNCTFETGLNHVADLSGVGAMAVLRGCQGAVSDHTFDLESGAVGIDYDSETIGNRGKFAISSGGVGIIRSGNNFGGSSIEDWGDARFTQRRTDRYIQYRPTWTVNSGSNVTPQEGSVQFGAGNNTVQELEVTRRFPTNHPSTIDFDLTFNSDPTTGSFDVEFIRASDNNLWRYRFQNGGTVELQKVVSGTPSTVLSHSYANDQNRHTYRAERSDLDVWEMFEDQASASGTTTDSFVPAVGSFGWDVQIRNTTDVTVDLGPMEWGH